MGILISIFKGISFLLFSLLSGFVLVFGKHSSNIKLYYVFTAMCIVGVILLV